MTDVMTYTSLVATLQDYLDRTDTRLQARIPTFISLGELRCAREVKSLMTKAVVTGTFTKGDPVVLKPVRWLETISINFGSSDLFQTVSRSAAAGVRTITTSTAHGLSAGDTVVVNNVGGTGYNGTYVVTAATQFTVTYSAGAVTEAVTADTGGFISAPFEDRTYLFPRGLEYASTYWPDRTQTGKPRYYADYDYTHWLVVPTPQVPYPFEVVYFQRPDHLSSDNEQNIFTEQCPDLLLYASLLETAPYLKNDSRIPTWKDYYMQASSAIKLENRERVDDASLKRGE